ncbi:hypothetical protein ACNTMW_27190 [Planosporangium sp. 12N6]|uniref:hypothetical protein n=1 Tax=Planosporangium spinosum TaxID=3402278 RepID=UPI003CEC4F33
MIPDPRELVALLSLEVAGDSAATALERCLPLVRELDAAGLDVVRDAVEARQPAESTTLYVPLGRCGDSYVVRAAADAAGPLLARFGWTTDRLVARWLPEHGDYAETDAPPAGPGAGLVTGLAVRSRAHLGLRDGLDGDEMVDNRGRRRRQLDAFAAQDDVVVRVHLVVAAPDLATAAERLLPLAEPLEPIGISLDRDPDREDLVNAALIYVAPGRPDLRTAASDAADRFGITGPYVRHEVRQWQVGAVEGTDLGAPAQPVTAQTVYVRLGVDPFADFGVLPTDDGEPLILADSEFSDEDAAELMRTLESMLFRVVLDADFVGVPEDDARTVAERLLRAALPVPDDEDAVSAVQAKSTPDGFVRVTALSAPEAAGGFKPAGAARAVRAVRDSVGGGPEWTVLREATDEEEDTAIEWRAPAVTRGMVRLQVRAGRGLGLAPEA